MPLYGTFTIDTHTINLCFSALNCIFSLSTFCENFMETPILLVLSPIQRCMQNVKVYYDQFSRRQLQHGQNISFVRTSYYFNAKHLLVFCMYKYFVSHCFLCSYILLLVTIFEAYFIQFSESLTNIYMRHQGRKIVESVRVFTKMVSDNP